MAATHLDQPQAAHILQCDDTAPNDRRLINLRFARSMSDREIAQRTGMTVDAVRAEFARLASLPCAPVQLELLPEVFRQPSANDLRHAALYDHY